MKSCRLIHCISFPSSACLTPLFIISSHFIVHCRFLFTTSFLPELQHLSLSLGCHKTFGHIFLSSYFLDIDRSFVLLWSLVGFESFLSSTFEYQYWREKEGVSFSGPRITRKIFLGLNFREQKTREDYTGEHETPSVARGLQTFLSKDNRSVRFQCFFLWFASKCVSPDLFSCGSCMILSSPLPERSPTERV